MTTPNGSEWSKFITAEITPIYEKLLAIAPQLLTAGLLLVVGVVIALALEYLSFRLISNLDHMFSKITGDKGHKKIKVQQSYSLIISKFIFWATIILFLDIAANILGSSVFSSWMDSIIGYFPQVITAFLILLSGFLLGSFTKTLINRSLTEHSSPGTAMIASAAQWLIMFLITLVAIEQLGINISAIANIIIVVIGCVFGGCALAFGMGTKSFTANIIGAQYAQKHCKVGGKIKFGDITGTIIDVTKTSIVIQTQDGQAIIPAKLFHEQICVITDPADD